MFPLGGRAAHRLEALPYGGPGPGARRWGLAAGRTLFELRSDRDRLPHGWVRLALEIHGPLPAAPRLLVDDGAGLSEAGALQLPLPQEGRVQAVVELPARVERLVLELGNVAGIRLGALGAREIGRASTAVHLAMPVVRRRLAEPWTIPGAAAKLLLALGSGEFLRVLLRKEVHEDPQLWYERWHERFARLSDADRAAIRGACAGMADPPVFSVLVMDGDQGAIESVREQLYPHRELCTVAGTADPRAVNAALRAARGDYLVLLQRGDRLAGHALFLFALAARERPAADLIYADEDSIDGRGRLYDPVFKPDWNQDLLFSTNYVGRCFAVRAALLAGDGALREDLGTAAAYDLLLRISSRGAVRHVPYPLLHRGATSPPEAAQRALQEHLGAAATVDPGPLPATHRVRWAIPSPPPLASLIIPTRNGREVLEPCVESLLAHTAYRPFEILIVDNGSDEPATLEYLRALEDRGAARVLRYPHPFNFSAINNFAVREARGEVVGLLNNDLEFTDPGWLAEMVSHALRPGVGCVGARLLYPDGTVQHAGVVLGIGGVADHVHKFLPAGAPGYCGRAQLTQDFSAVTAACLLIRRETYLDVGGFDEELAVAFNDVDFCLRVRERGLRNVWTPFATVIHHESKSRGSEDTLAKMLRFRGEIRRLKARWGRALLEDPAYSPNLTLDAKNFSLAWPPRVRPPWK